MHFTYILSLSSFLLSCLFVLLYVRLSVWFGCSSWLRANGICYLSIIREWGMIDHDRFTRCRHR